VTCGWWDDVDGPVPLLAVELSDRGVELARAGFTAGLDGDAAVIARHRTATVERIHLGACLYLGRHLIGGDYAPADWLAQDTCLVAVVAEGLIVRNVLTVGDQVKALFDLGLALLAEVRLVDGPDTIPL
jgi:hypothetical protein